LKKKQNKKKVFIGSHFGKKKEKRKPPFTCDDGPRAICTRLLFSPRNKEVLGSASFFAFFFSRLRLFDIQCDGHIQNNILRIQQTKPIAGNERDR
jgi:hypothetical protein